MHGLERSCVRAEKKRQFLQAAKLGTLMGVFFPCLQNIFGVLFFIRLSWIVGTAGVLQGLAVVLSCVSVVSSKPENMFLARFPSRKNTHCAVSSPSLSHTLLHPRTSKTRRFPPPAPGRHKSLCPANCRSFIIISPQSSLSRRSPETNLGCSLRERIYEVLIWWGSTAEGRFLTGKGTRSKFSQKGK